QAAQSAGYDIGTKGDPFADLYRRGFVVKAQGEYWHRELIRVLGFGERNAGLCNIIVFSSRAGLRQGAVFKGDSRNSSIG
ncbi:hypothetical protein QQ73_09650, partial [Candidatus Endoriftia persephone str. Guaymas]|nr:hypothetical protein [Candidatus Endoriftia persephone str. Guaymas]